MASFNLDESDYHLSTQSSIDESSIDDDENLLVNMYTYIARRDDITFDSSDIDSTQSRNSQLEAEAHLIKNSLANQGKFKNSLLQEEEYKLPGEAATDLRNNSRGSSIIIHHKPAALSNVYKQQPLTRSIPHNNDDILSSLKDIQKVCKLNAVKSQGNSTNHACQEVPTKMQKPFNQQLEKSLKKNNSEITLAQYKLNPDPIPSASHQDSIVSDINTSYKDSCTLNDYPNKGTIKESISQLHKIVKLTKYAKKKSCSSFKCFVCGQDIGSKSDLKHHMANTHGIGTSLSFEKA